MLHDRTALRRALPALLPCVLVACATTSPAPTPTASPTPVPAGPTASPTPVPTPPAYAEAYGDGCIHLGEEASVAITAGASKDAAVTAPVSHERLLVTLPASGEGWLRFSPAAEGQVFVFASEPATLSVRTVETGRAVTLVPLTSPVAAACPGMKTASRFSWALTDGKMDLQLLASVSTLSLVVFDETPEAEEE
ncbi:MAG: hypothetical protein VKP57_10295 [Candidatus Sericytochromatia bacterium]|nr:hypothetical protein [Candidatus Sericytochromatia bacterium]